MQTTHCSVTGQIYGHVIHTGRRKSPDPKTQVGLRLHETTRKAISETGMSEQMFIEQAVYEKLYGLRITETVEP